MIQYFTIIWNDCDWIAVEKVKEKKSGPMHVFEMTSKMTAWQKVNDEHFDATSTAVSTDVTVIDTTHTIQYLLIDHKKGTRGVDPEHYTFIYLYALGVAKKIDFFLINFFIWKSFLSTKWMILVFIPSY